MVFGASSNSIDFLDHGVERLAVARYQAAHLFKASWDQKKQPDQMKRIAEILTEFDAKKIVLNYSEVFGIADEITFSEYHALRSALPKKLKNRIVPGSDLAIAWLETSIPAEMEIYLGIMEIVHGIIAE